MKLRDLATKHEYTVCPAIPAEWFVLQGAKRIATFVDRADAEAFVHMRIYKETLESKIRRVVRSHVKCDDALIEDILNIEV